MLPRFHKVSGRYVQIPSDGNGARLLREDPLGASIAFMDRPLRVSETIGLRVIFTQGRPGFVTFGFSKEEPKSLAEEVLLESWQPFLFQLRYDDDSIFSVFLKSSEDVYFWTVGQNGSRCTGADFSKLWLFVELPSADTWIHFIELNIPPPPINRLKNLRPLNFLQYNASYNERPIRFEDCFVVSDRPIEINERVCIYIAKMKDVEIGFTIQHPESLTSNADESKYWIKPVKEYDRNPSYVNYYVNSKGDVYFSIDEKTEIKVMSRVSTNNLMWAVIYKPQSEDKVTSSNAIFTSYLNAYSPLIANESFTGIEFECDTQQSSESDEASPALTQSNCSPQGNYSEPHTGTEEANTDYWGLGSPGWSVLTPPVDD